MAFITTSGKFFVSSPLPPSHTTATKRKNPGFLMALCFSQEDYVETECCLLLSLLSPVLSLPSHWRNLLMPIPGKFQGAVSIAAAAPKPKKEPVCLCSTENLQWINLSWWLVLIWLPPHSPVAEPAFSISTWVPTSWPGSSCTKQKGFTHWNGIWEKNCYLGSWVFLWVLWLCWPAQCQVLVGR